MKIIGRLFRIVLMLAVLVSLLIYTVGGALLNWYKETFGVSFVEIFYTIMSPIVGADTDFLHDALLRSAPYFGCVLLIVFMLLFLNKHDKKVFTLMAAVVFAISSFGSVKVLKEADNTLKVIEYLKSRSLETQIYEDYYVKPDYSNIIAEKEKNLIHIYLESMETTYASQEDGGYQPGVNYIPRLTQMASENLSFSDKESLLGGPCSLNNAGWTMAAIFASESGLPFSFPVEGNSDFSDRKAMASGTRTLGDILENKGYYQEFLCGSDALFGGRRTFYQQHGNFEIYDWGCAVRDGYVSEEDFVWWGLEDKNLYKIAKDELTRISEQEQPFNFTMLTVDTHHVGGWLCDECLDEYPEQLANVLACADRQIFDFVNWCKEQPWYEDTVIVIQGDHPRMDTILVDGIPYFDRTIYNCFINSSPENVGNLSLNNREFSTMDMFPTILAAMGYSIPEDRLGLGTNMFSGKKTIIEEMGLDKAYEELSKYSTFYILEFS